MAVLFFTNNASTGAGSLVEAVKNASPGDVVRPDETVFERGSTIEIVLASELTVDKNLTLDASPFRVALNGGGSVACAFVANGATVAFSGFDFIGGATSQNGGGLNAETGANVVLNRCRVCGCDAAQHGGGIYVDDAASLTLADSAVFGNRAQYGGGVYVGDDAAATLSGATVCGNVGHDFDGETSTSALAAVNSILGNAFDDSETSGSVVDVASSSVGFVAPPPDGLTFENWDANAWQSWNLRLLDDASGAPSPYRDSGDVDAASKYDLDGNFRGRESDGASTCSPGAYETIQADLFWVGVGASGAEVVSPSFLTSDGWAASRFATVSGDAAPQVGQTFFIGRDVAFVDALATSSNQRHGLYVGGGTVVAFESDARLFLDKLQIAANARLAFNRGAADSSRFGAFSRVDGVFTTLPNAVADDNVYLASVIVYGTVISEPTYGTLNVLTSADVSVERMSGVYVCNAFRIQQNGTRVGQTITVSDGTTIRARSVNFGSADAANYVESFFSRPVTLKLQGAASVSMPTTTRESWADDFVVDVTDATSATLTLCGQTVCGGAPTSEITLNGVAQADARGLDVASLALTADASLSVNGGKVCVATLSVADGAAVDFSGVDAVLSATESATVGSTTLTGTGYFATPPGTDLTAATFAETIRVCDCGAALTSFSAVALNSTEAAISWTGRGVGVCLERKTSDSWEVLATRAESPITVAIVDSGGSVFRAFDGVRFLSDGAWFFTGDQYTVRGVCFQAPLNAAAPSDYGTRGYIMTANNNGLIYWGQSVTFLGQIVNAFDGELLRNDNANIENVCYSLYRRGTGLFTSTVETTPIFERRAADVSCVLETPQSSEQWQDNGEPVEYNFALTPPNSLEEPFLEAPGEYLLRVAVELKTGNPIILIYEFTVL